MSQIQDFGCMVDGCENDAAELVATDIEFGPRELILLCRDHHTCENDDIPAVFVGIGSRVLVQDTAGSWFFIPEADV